MDSTLHALAGILLKALPTFFLVVLLHFYLKHVFFKPLEKVLRDRYEATDGARKLAEQSMERAAARMAEYEAAMRAARAEVYQAQERVHKEFEDRHAAGMAEARACAEGSVREAKAQLGRDVETAKALLAGEARALSNQIAESILGRTAA